MNWKVKQVETEKILNTLENTRMAISAKVKENPACLRACGSMVMKLNPQQNSKK